MAPKAAVVLTDHVKELMKAPADADAVPLRRQLRERRKDEVRQLYAKAAVVKEARDRARNVINNPYHQELETKTEVPVVYGLLAGQFGGTRNADPSSQVKPVRVKVQEAAAAEAARRIEQSGTATQTVVGTVDQLPNPPQRAEPKLEEILAAAKSVRPKSSLGVAHFDKATGREVKSVAVDANPSDIIRATMRSTSARPHTATTKPVPPMPWRPARTVEVSTDLTGPRWDRALVKDPPKMGLTTLEVKRIPIPEQLRPGPHSGARHASRPKDTFFIF